MDLNRMEERLGLEKDEFRELVEIFLEASFSDLEILNRSVKDRDPDRILEAAHSIKGAAGNLGFSEIYEIAKSIEAQARQRHLLKIPDSLRSIRENLERISDALKAA